ESEAAAEALAQRQPPRAVDAAAERGVDDELHAAGLVEESLRHDALGGGDDAEGALAFIEILRQLLRGLGRDAGVVLGPARISSFFPDSTDRLRKLSRPRGTLSEPERDAGRRALS